MTLLLIQAASSTSYWPYVIGPLTAIFWAAASLYVKDRSRATIREEFDSCLGAFRLEVQASINKLGMAIQASDSERKLELTEAKAALRASVLADINGTYQRTAMCKQIESTISTQVAAATGKIAEVENEVRRLSTYTHEFKHNTDSQLLGLRAHHLAEMRERERALTLDPNTEDSAL